MLVSRYFVIPGGWCYDLEKPARPRPKRTLEGMNFNDDIAPVRPSISVSASVLAVCAGFGTDDRGCSVVVASALSARAPSVFICDATDDRLRR